MVALHLSTPGVLLSISMTMPVRATTLSAYDNPSWNSQSHLRRRKYRFVIAASHHLTFMLGRVFPRTFPLVFVLGFPKSGTSWVCQLVAEYMRLPFPQNSLFPIGFPAVVHGHEVVRPGFSNAIYVVRDGRDAMVSLYYHLQGQARAANLRQNSREFPRSFEEFVNRQLKRPSGTRVDWGRHFRSFYEADASQKPTLIRYESLLENPIETLACALERFTGAPPDRSRVQNSVEKFSFAKQRSAANISEDRASYLRRGQAGDWQNHFTADAAKAFSEACGEMLVAAGYEVNDLWASRSNTGVAA